MSNFLTVEECIELRLLGNNDLLQRDRMKLLKFAKYVYDDLKLNVIKQPKRQFIEINKRTNTIDLPCEYTMLSSVSIRHNGIFYPVWRNPNITEEIVDVLAVKDCGCENNCHHQVCNTIKNYEAITEVMTDKLPNGQSISFNCVSRKVIDGAGNLTEQKQYPQRVYTSGIWTDTVLYTENIRLCKLELDEKGCACDSQHNISAVCGTCDSGIPFGGDAENPPSKDVNTWKYFCSTNMDFFGVQCGKEIGCLSQFNNIYNISEDGNRLIFPSNFGFDKVLVRFYETTKTSEIKIPVISVDAFIAGLMWWAVRFDDTKQQLAMKYENDYTKMKWGLFGVLNRKTIAEWRMTMNAPVNFNTY